MMLGIHDFIGIPFKNKGRDYSGVDCYGLVYLVYRDYKKISIPKYQDYKNALDKKEADKKFRDHKKEWFEVSEPHFLDVVLFGEDNGLETHVGLYIDMKHFMHIRRNGNVCIERYKDFQKKRIGVYRYADDV